VKWSWRIGTVAGIPVYLHGTFLLLIAFFFVQDLAAGGTVAAAFAGVMFLLAVFATVVMHELGHALAARRFGIRTRDITLLPIGGVARLERIPEVPRQELWVALAGPAVNLGIAGVTYAVAAALRVTVSPLDLEPGAPGALGRFLAVNLWLALFNLIPAFPMDGGRALRALLAERYEYVKATDIAAALGQGLAWVFGFVGLFTNPFLVFIALFVWMGATAEASSVSARAALAGLPVARAMITDFRAVEADDRLQRAADLVIAGSQHDFPVLEGRRIVGVLTRDALVRALAERGLDAAVRDAMTREFETADPREMLEQAFARLQAGRCAVMPVVSGGALVGLLTADNVGEYVLIRGALSQRRG
jgi:Zn-dependent protease/CBS domain-containing protein